MSQAKFTRHLLELIKDKYEKKKARYNSDEASLVKNTVEKSVKELDRLNKVYSHDFSLETGKTFNSYVSC